MKLSNLSFTYQDGDEVILKDISLSFPNNGLVSLCGPSGSGKTTLLNIIAGFIEPSEGEIENTEDVTYCTSEDLNINILSVLDNLALFSKNTEKIQEYLTLFKLDKLKKKTVKELSKGEQIRVTIIRTLLSDSKVLLFDEPSANLDEKTGELVFSILQKEAESRLIIIASHDINLAKKYSDEIYSLENFKLKLISKRERAFTNKNISQSDNSTSYRLLLKYALKKIFYKPFSYFCNLILAVVGCAMILLGINANFVDINKSTESYILNYPYSAILIDNFKTDSSDTPSTFFKAQSNEGFQLLNAHYQNHDIDTVFYEDALPYYSFSDAYKQACLKAENSIYPILVNNSFLTDYRLSKGSSLDLSFGDYSINFRCTIFDTLENCSNLSYEEPLIVIPKSLQEAYISKYGYFVDEFQNGIQNIVDSYYENSFSAPTIRQFNSIKDFKSATNVINFKEMPEDYEGIVYIGDEPTSKGDVILNNYYDYYVLTGQTVEGNEFNHLNNLINTPFMNGCKDELQEMWETYDSHYKISAFRQFSMLNNTEEYTVHPVGFLAERTSSIENGEKIYEFNYPSINYSLIDSETIEYLSNKINVDNFSIFAQYNNIASKEYSSYLMTRNCLANNVNNLYNSNISISNLSSAKMIMSAVDLSGFSTWMLYLGLSVFALSLLISLLYINNVYKSMQKDLAIISLYSKDKRAKPFLLLSYNSAIVIPFILLGIVLGYCLELAISSHWFKLISGNLTGGTLFFKSYIGILVLICIGILYLAISLLPLLKKKKLETLDVLKHE